MYKSGWRSPLSVPVYKHIGTRAQRHRNNIIFPLCKHHCMYSPAIWMHAIVLLAPAWDLDMDFSVYISTTKVKWICIFSFSLPLTNDDDVNFQLFTSTASRAIASAADVSVVSFLFTSLLSSFFIQLFIYICPNGIQFQIAHCYCCCWTRNMMCDTWHMQSKNWFYYNYKR